MHEYSLANELIKTLMDQVPEEKLERARKVHLRLGELRVLSREALSQAYQVITEDTILSGSELEYENVSPLVDCKNCEFSGSLDYEQDSSMHYSVPVLTCPECGGPVEIKEGRELEVRTLTVTDRESA